MTQDCELIDEYGVGLQDDAAGESRKYLNIRSGRRALDTG